jgi:hypothetical protein
MDIAILIATVGVLCIGCFCVGAKVGQTVSKGEEINLPTVNPMEAYRQHKAKQEAQQEQDRLETIMQNVENYDGTSNGQKDVPRG